MRYHRLTDTLTTATPVVIDFEGAEMNMVPLTVNQRFTAYFDQSDATLEVTGDADPSGGSPTWHPLTLANDMYVFEGPCSGIRITKGASDTKYNVLIPLT